MQSILEGRDGTAEGKQDGGEASSESMPAACPGGLPQRFGRLPKDVRRSIAQRVRRRDYQNVSVALMGEVTKYERSQAQPPAVGASPPCALCVLQDYLSRYWADAPCARNG